MITYTTERGKALRGVCKIPGDKSISHRALILGSLASGKTEVTGLLEGEDILSTLAALKAMGISICRSPEGIYSISGGGLWGLRMPKRNLDLGNSGTSMRLLCGVLAGQRFESTLTGDASLLSRPMERVTNPLKEMGASIEASFGGRAPINIKPVDQLTGLQYRMPLASAQVKSAILLAGMYAVSDTVIEEDISTRDHTERMLEGFGYPIYRDRNMIRLKARGMLRGTDLIIPGDFSSAAFFIVAASIVGGSKIKLLNLGINPTRTGLIEILQLMGAKIEKTNVRTVGGEPIADLMVESSCLRGVDVPRSLIASMIDELPVLSIAAACAKGTTRISGAEELRFKESDRITTIGKGLRALGINVTEVSDGMIIEGGVVLGGTVDSQEDHRIAMAFSIAGLSSIQPVTVLKCDRVATSFPGFVSFARNVGMKLECEEMK